MVDLPPDQLALVKTILQSHISEFSVWVFGSRITKKSKPFSDLDLAIMTNSPLSLSRMARLREAFAESNLPIKVDIVDWAATNENFRQIIQESHAIIQTGLTA